MLREECQKGLDLNPFAKALQIEVMEASQGFIKAKIPFRKELTNMYGDIHGGALYTAVDTVCGIAASTYGYYVTTVDGSIQYLKAGRNTDYVICEGRVVKSGKNISVVQFQVTDERDMLLNTGTFTFYNLKEKIEY